MYLFCGTRIKTIANKLTFDRYANIKMRNIDMFVNVMLTFCNLQTLIEILMPITIYEMHV